MKIPKSVTRFSKVLTASLCTGSIALKSQFKFEICVFQLNRAYTGIKAATDFRFKLNFSSEVL